MKFHAALMLSALALVGCGGGSGGGSSVASDTTEPVTDFEYENPNPNYRESREVYGTIGDGNAALIAEEVVQIMSFLALEGKRFFDVSNESVYDDNRSQVSTTEAYECLFGGGWARYIYSPSNKGVAGNAVLAGGDTEDLYFYTCGDENLSAGVYLDGHRRTEVLSGVYDGDGPVTDNTDVKFEYKQMTTYSYTRHFIYWDGDIRYTVSGNAVAINASDLDIKERYSIFEVEFGVTNLKATVMKGKYNDGYWDTFELSAQPGLTIDARKSGYLLDVEIMEPLLINTIRGEFLTDGVIKVTSDQGTLTVTIEDSGALWELDTDGLPGAEMNGTISRAYYR
jgi:hypothetical protein